MKTFFTDYLPKWLNRKGYFGGYRYVLYLMLGLSIIPFFGAALAWFAAGELKNKQRYRIFALAFLVFAFFALSSYFSREVISDELDPATHTRRLTVIYGANARFYLIAMYGINYLLIFFLRKEIVNEPKSEWEANLIDDMEIKARAEVAKARQKINVARTPINEIIKEQENIVSYGNIYGVQSTILNINSATLGQIEALPRVGKTLALIILQNRQHFGEFTSLDELCRRCSVKPHIRIAMEPLVSFTTFSGENFKQERRGRRID